MILFNTLVGRMLARIDARFRHPLGLALRKPIASIAPEENHDPRSAHDHRMYFGVFVITGSYRSDGHITFRR